jgi:hypothetical protein
MTERDRTIAAVVGRASSIIRRQGGPAYIGSFGVRDAIEQAAEIEADRVDRYDWARFAAAVLAQIEDRFGYKRGALKVRR